MTSQLPSVHYVSQLWIIFFLYIAEKFLLVIYLRKLLPILKSKVFISLVKITFFSLEKYESIHGFKDSGDWSISILAQLIKLFYVVRRHAKINIKGGSCTEPVPRRRICSHSFKFKIKINTMNSITMGKRCFRLFP